MKPFLFGLMALSLLVGKARQADADYVFITLQGFEANGINDSGQIVGSYDAGGFLYSDGRYTTINVASPDRLATTHPNGINNAGQIVGQYAEGRIYQGFLVNRGTYTTFNAPDSTFTRAYGINDSGQIVGSYSSAYGSADVHGFLLSGGTYSTIDVPGATTTLTSASGINNRGQIVGGYGPNIDSLHGFLLSEGTYTTIDVPGSKETSAHGINDYGQLVGVYYVGPTAHGFLLSDGTYTMIDVPGSAMTIAEGINDAGQIVGQYYDFGGKAHAFLASPVPGPSTLLLLGIATLALLGWGRWRRALVQIRR